MTSFDQRTNFKTRRYTTKFKTPFTWNHATSEAAAATETETEASLGAEATTKN